MAAQEIDVEAHVRATPPGATCKGVLFAGILERVRKARPDLDPSRVAGVEPRRYLPFLNYPYTELLRIIPAAARVVFPSAPASEAVRLLGRDVFVDLRTTRAGRILLGILVDDLAGVLMSAARAYSVTVTVGRYEAERPGPRHVRLRFDDYPGYLETYDLGVLEGAVAYFREQARARATRAGPRAGTIDVEW